MKKLLFLLGVPFVFAASLCAGNMGGGGGTTYTATPPLTVTGSVIGGVHPDTELATYEFNCDDFENPDTALVEISTCDTYGGWVINTAADAVGISATHKEGSYGLTFSKNGTNVSATIEKHPSPALDITKKYVSVWVYIKDATTLAKIATVRIVPIFDGGNYNQFIWGPGEPNGWNKLAVGWNLLDSNQLNPSIGPSGNPANMDYIDLNIRTNVATDTMALGDVVFDYLVAGNHLINKLATSEQDVANPSFRIKAFDDTTKEGVFCNMHIPSWATSMTVTVKGNAKTGPPAARTVGMNLAYLKAETGVTNMFWASHPLADVAVTDTYLVTSTNTFALTAPVTDLVANTDYLLELYRDTPTAGTNLTGDFDLKRLDIKFQ